MIGKILFGALAVIGAWVTWEHFNTPRPVNEVIGGSVVSRPSDDQRLKPPQKDLIGGYSYGLRGDPAVQLSDLVAMRGGGDKFVNYETPSIIAPDPLQGI